jgi:serine/threonine protein kinase
MGAREGDSTQLTPGIVLHLRYEIVKRIGGGGMGSVYQARDKRRADRLCAVKEMIELFADESQRAKAVKDFTRDAQLLASLEHRSIPTIFDYFIEGGRYYLVMKFISGGDLADQMRKRGGRVDELTVTRWGIQVCDVLHYIHNQDPPIIYRDLKPANLMLDDKQGRIMLIDFGIARFVAPTQKDVTAIGTMGYAPPELFAGKGMHIPGSPDAAESVSQVYECLRKGQPAWTPSALDRVLVDTFETSIPRPSTEARQKRVYSGKKKRHTLKTQVVTDTHGEVLTVSGGHRGPAADKRVYEASGAGEQFAAVAKQGDLAWVGTAGVVTPQRKPRGGQLSDEQRDANRQKAKVRVHVEHGIRRLKASKIVREDYRHAIGLFPMVASAAAGLLHFSRIVATQ